MQGRRRRAPPAPSGRPPACCKTLHPPNYKAGSTCGRVSGSAPGSLPSLNGTAVWHMTGYHRSGPPGQPACTSSRPSRGDLPPASRTPVMATGSCHLTAGRADARVGAGSRGERLAAAAPASRTAATRRLQAREPGPLAITPDRPHSGTVAPAPGRARAARGTRAAWSQLL